MGLGAGASSSPDAQLIVTWKATIPYAAVVWNNLPFYSRIVIWIHGITARRCTTQAARSVNELYLGQFPFFLCPIDISLFHRRFLCHDWFPPWANSLRVNRQL